MHFSEGVDNTTGNTVNCCLASSLLAAKLFMFKLVQHFNTKLLTLEHVSKLCEFILKNKCNGLKQKN